jgi:hypothetical protein
MKRTLFVTAALLVSVTCARGQLYLADSNVWVTGQERLRLEYRANNSTLNSAIAADTDWWLLHRARIGVGAKACDWFTVFGELQDAREIDSTRVPPNQNLEEDKFDWHQGWLEVANYKEFPLGLKVGRQELSYGGERLIGLSDWSNVGRVFDAARLRWQSEQWWVDAFGANVVRNSVTTGKDGSFDDTAYWQDDFYGVYASTKAVAGNVIDVYALLRDKDNAAFSGPARQLYTLGTRVVSNDKLLPWDYAVEFAGQFGHIQGPGGSTFGETNAAWATQQAFAGTVNVGYTWKQEWKPRLAIGYDYASGDSNPADGKNESFDPLYPTSHRPLGFIDLFTWKNVHNPHATLALSPHKTVKLQLDGHLFWLAEGKDAWYRSTGSAIRRDTTGGSSSFVGSEIDVTATYAPHKRVKCQVGYSHFFAGDFVKDTGAHSDAKFFYTQVTLSL